MTDPSPAGSYQYANAAVRGALRNTRRPYGVTSVVLGLFLLAIAGFVAWSHADRVQAEGIGKFVRAQLDREPISIAHATLSFAGVAISTLTGLALLAGGLVDLRRFAVARDVPKAYGDPANAASALLGPRILRVFPEQPLNTFLGAGNLKQRSLLLTPGPRIVAERLIASFRTNRLWLIVILLAGTACSFPWRDVLQSGSTITIPFDPQPFPIVLAAVLIALLVASARMLYLVMPSASLTEHVEHDLQELHGAQKPEMVCDYLEQEFRTFERDAMPNRIARWNQPPPDQTGAGDTTNFRWVIMGEQNPRPIPDNVVSGSYFGAWVGSAMIALGAAMLCFAPAVGPSPIIALCSYALGAIVLLFAGMGFRDLASRLFDLRRFESLMMTVDVRGSVSVSKVVVGRGMHDSVMSENEANRTHFTVRYYAAIVTSECPELNQPRYLVGMAAGDEPRRAIEDVKNRLGSRVTTGIGLATPDITSRGLNEVLQTNALMDRARKGRDLPSLAAGMPALPGAAVEARPSAGTPGPDLLANVLRAKAKAEVLWETFGPVGKDPAAPSWHLDAAAAYKAAATMLEHKMLAESLAEYERFIATVTSNHSPRPLA